MLCIVGSVKPRSRRRSRRILTLLVHYTTPAIRLGWLCEIPTDRCSCAVIYSNIALSNVCQWGFLTPNAKRRNAAKVLQRVLSNSLALYTECSLRRGWTWNFRHLYETPGEIRRKLILSGIYPGSRAIVVSNGDHPGGFRILTSSCRESRLNKVISCLI